MKKILFILLVINLTFASAEAAVIASGNGGYFNNDTIRWELDNLGKLVISGNGKLTNISALSGYSSQIVQLVISEGITETDSIQILGSNSGATQLSEIWLPDSLKIIGNNSFRDLPNLNSVHFGQGLTDIEDYAFYGTDVSEIVLPDSLETIGNSAFYDCNNLTKLTFGTGIQTINDHAFSLNESLGLLSK